MQVDLDRLTRLSESLFDLGYTARAKLVLDARDEITRLRDALRVACEEIRDTRRWKPFLEMASIDLLQSNIALSRQRTDAAIDLATGEPRTP